MNSFANKVKTANYVLASTLMHSSAMVAIALAPTYFPDMSGMEDPGGEVIEFTVASNDVVYPEPVTVEKLPVQEVVAAPPPPPPKDQLPDKVEEEVTPAVIAKETPVVKESPVEVEKPSELEEERLKRQQEELAEAERLRKEKEKEAVMAAAAAEALRIAQEQEKAEAAAEAEAQRLAEEQRQKEIAAAEAAKKKAEEAAKRKAAEEKAKAIAAAEAAERAGRAKGAEGTGNSPEKIVVEQDYLQLKQMAGNKPPKYSQDMRLKKLQGRGQIVYDVTKNGRVANLRLIKSTGHPELDRAAINAFKNYRFVPGQAGSTVHNFEFNLKGPAKAANGRLRSSK